MSHCNTQKQHCGYFKLVRPGHIRGPVGCALRTHLIAITYVL